MRTSTLFAGTLSVVLLACGCEQTDYDTTTTPPADTTPTTPRDGTLTTPRDRDLSGPVTTPGTTQPGAANQDQQLEAQLRAQLTMQPGLENATNVTIQVRNGRVMLSGWVATQEQKDQIAKFCEQKVGAGQIDNQIEVRPETGTPE